MQATKLHYHLFSLYSRLGTRYEETLLYSEVYGPILSMSSSMHIASVLNYPLEDWFLGNAVQDFLNLVFLPEMYMVEDPGYNYLTQRQVHDAACVLYRLVTFHGLSVDVADYYGEKPLAQLDSLAYSSRYDTYPTYIQEYVGQFRAILKHGAKLIDIQHGVMLRFILRRRADKRKRAYNRIATWWFEICCSPYTAVGSRLLKRKAQQWLSTDAGKSKK